MEEREIRVIYGEKGREYKFIHENRKFMRKLMMSHCYQGPVEKEKAQYDNRLS